MGNYQVQCGKFVGEKKLGQTRHMRSAALPECAELVKDFREMDNLKDIFDLNAKETPEKPFLGTRTKTINEKGETVFGEYEWKTYSQVHQDASALANYLMTHDLVPKTETEEGIFRFLCLYAKNREEWVVTDFACILSAVTVVTLYDTLGKDSIDYIMDQTYIKTIVLSADKVKNVVELKREGKISLCTHIIYFDECKQELLDQGTEAGLTFIKYSDALAEGKHIIGSLDGTIARVPFDKVGPDTFYTFSYTSGTTGMPKGVMLTHQNFVANIGGMYKFDCDFEIREDDVYISYLPLAHVFERCLLMCAMGYKMQYGFFQGDVMKLRDDLAVLKPTVMVSVPRLYNRFYDVMQQKIKELTGMKKKITEWGIQKKLYNLEHYGYTTNQFYDTVVFNKFKAILGGRVRVMITGSAPISKEVLDFLKIAFCCQIHEGYGQTECGAPAAITWNKDPTSGHVGGPYPTLEIKLVDVPDMNYTSDDKDEQGKPTPRGEVCYRGYNTFKGYFRQPDQTKEAIDERGWVHTGDIGMFLSNGALKIIDRKKNIFKLSQGEYIAPDKIENKVAQSLYIQQIFVYGDSLQHYVVAVIVPDKVMIEKWAASNDLTGSYTEIIENEKTHKFFVEEVKSKCKEAGFFGFEIPQKILLTETVFTAENDLLTPTFKLKRNEAKKYFFQEIKSMYDGAKLQGEE